MADHSPGPCGLTGPGPVDSGPVDSGPAERAPRRLRADAARNVDALLEAAKAVFASSGVDAPAKEIADLAGVGVGTLYRHFPQRSDLVKAVFERGVDACADAAPALAEANDPAAALAQWLHRYTEFLATKRGLAAALHSGDPAFDALPGYFMGRLEPALGSLLDAAAASGEIRADVSPRELLHAVATLCMPVAGDGVAYSQRMVALLIDGMRYGAVASQAGSLPAISLAAGEARFAVRWHHPLCPEPDEGARMAADFADRTDFDNASHGLIARLTPGVVRAADGRVVYDADAFTAATSGQCPATVHPSLWRQSQLTAIQGLFEVTEGIYQLRGIDLSNMTLVEGKTGVIVIDPLVSAEVAAAGLALYREHRGDRKVTAVIYTHSHIDHFGGVLGVVDADADVPIVAPAHFLEHAVSENVYAGVAMLRRGLYHTGSSLPVGPNGQVGVGLGPGTSTGTVGLLAPTVDITRTGQQETLDGVPIVFQITPGTEAPAEMNFYFPDRRALCVAENVTHNLHNVLTLRGAQVRDARAWSRYIAEAVELFGHDAEVAFASHHWPTWGTGNVLRLLTQQRDLYAFLHDQTLRLMNQGYTGSEIAEMIQMPPALDAAWHTHGYYGSVSHNVKAIYQRYLGWYDGNPAHLWQHPPEAAAARYVRVIGGVAATVAAAREFADAGDLRFAAELASHAVFADPSDEAARALLAQTFTRLGFGAECATWRNNYLTGARELRTGPAALPLSSAGMAPALTVTQLFDGLAIRIDGKRAWGTSTSVRWHFTDTGEVYRMELSNGALIHYPTSREEPVDLVITLTRPQLLAMLAGDAVDGVQLVGHKKVFDIIASLADQPDPAFPIVTP